MSLFGEQAHINFMEQIRLVYRNPVAEVLLLSAVAVQIFTGVKLFLMNRGKAIGFFNRLQHWTGLYLSAFFLIHLSAVLGGRYILDLDTNLYFGVAGLNTFPFFLFFGPYYGLAIAAFFGHIAAIHSNKMNKEVLGLSVNVQSKIILALGVVLTIITLYGLTNGFNGIEIPDTYDVLIGK